MRLMLTAAAALALAACAHAPSDRAPRLASPILPAPAAIHTRNVPAVPAELARRVGAYADFRGAGLLDWSPDGGDLLVVWREANTNQLHRVGAPGGRLTQLTRAAEPTADAAWLPAERGVIVFERDAGGSEAAQIYRLDLASGAETRLTDPTLRHDRGPFTRRGTELVVTSVPLDRTAAGGTRREIATELSLLNPVSGVSRTIASMPGAGWYPIDFSADDRELLVGRYQSANESEVWRVRVADGQSARVLPAQGAAPAFFGGAKLAADGRRIFVSSDHAGEFRQLYRFDPATDAFEAISSADPWDVASFELSKDRSRIAAIVNARGRGELRLYDAASLKPLALPTIAGSVSAARFSPDGQRLAISTSSAAAPSEVAVIDLASGRFTPWVRPDTAGLDTARFSPTEVIEWTSFDGRAVSGLITRPPAQFTGKRPVLIEIHGGPEGQSRLGFKGRYNYLVNEWGVVLIEPNVRGSAGFGKTFLTLDNGRLREDSVKDIGSLLDWIATQPDLDASRVVVQGGSYGGYMALAVATHYSNRIRGAIDTVGISNFVSFLERTESYRRDLRRVEYGDERDPAMREFLLSISPTHNAARIKVPLFVVHGRNDPRVPVQEAEQIAATVEQNGAPVWLMMADNEGHGFAKKENADYLFLARLRFLEQVLLK